MELLRKLTLIAPDARLSEDPVGLIQLELGGSVQIPPAVACPVKGS